MVEWATKLSNVLDRHQRARRRGKRKLSTTSKPKTGATPANKTGPGTGAGEGGSRFSILTEGKPDNGSKQDVVTSSQVGPSHDSRKERKEGISTSKKWCGASAWEVANQTHRPKTMKMRIAWINTTSPLLPTSGSYCGCRLADGDLLGKPFQFQP